MSNEHDDKQAMLLEAYCNTLTEGDDAATTELEATLASTAHTIDDALHPPLPSPRFVAALQAQLEQQLATRQAIAPASIATLPPQSRRPLQIARVAMGRVAAASLLILAVAAALLFAASYNQRQQGQALPVQPDVKDAQELIARAKAMYRSGEIKSFALTELELNPASTKPSTEWRSYYQSPNLSRVEANNFIVSIDDGKNTWNYQAPQSPEYGGDIMISQYNNLEEYYGLPTRSVEKFNSSMLSAEGCYQPTLTGTDVVAGRPVYVLDFGGPLSTCKDNGLKQYGRQVLWIDHDSYFVLRDKLFTKTDIEVTTYEVTSIQYNLTLDTNLFTFVMPTTANFVDFRLRDVSNDEDLRDKIADAVSTLSFDTYLPTYILVDLKAVLASYDARTGEYSIGFGKLWQRGSFVNTPMPVLPDMGGLSLSPSFTILKITMSLVTSDTIANASRGYRVITVGGNQAWIGCPVPEVKEPCPLMYTNIVLVKGKTLITISGEGISEEELIKVAASLTPIERKPQAGAPFPTMPMLPTEVPTEVTNEMPNPIPSAAP